MASLVHPSQEEELGQEEAQGEVQVQPGVLTAKTSTQQEGGDGQGQAQQRDDHAQLTDDMQGEIHLGGRGQGRKHVGQNPHLQSRKQPCHLLLLEQKGAMSDWGLTFLLDTAQGLSPCHLGLPLCPSAPFQFPAFTLCAIIHPRHY